VSRYLGPVKTDLIRECGRVTDKHFWNLTAESIRNSHMQIPPVKSGTCKLGILQLSGSILKALLIPQG
jgi:hypothetical protein